MLKCSEIDNSIIYSVLCKIWSWSRYKITTKAIFTTLVVHRKVINICYPQRVAIVTNIGCLSGLYMHGECGWKLQPTFNAGNIYGVLSRKVMIKPVIHKIAILQATYTLMRSDNMCMSHIHTHKPVRKKVVENVCVGVHTSLCLQWYFLDFHKMNKKAQNVYF